MMSDEFTQGSMPPPVVATHIACPNCGYNLTGVAIGSACPECGLVIGRGMFAADNLPTSGKAIASLVLGIVSIVMCSAYGVLSVPCGIIAIVMANGVKQQIVRQEVAPSSAGLAKAGWVCGVIGLVLGGLMMLFLLLMLGFGFAGGF